LINRVNSRPFLGKSAIVPALNEPTVFESNMMRLAVDRSRVDPRYLIVVLQQRHVRDQLLARAKDAINQSSINQGDVCSVIVQLPPLALQSDFVERSAEAQATIAQQERMLEASDRLVASLMAQLFDGGISTARAA
jgi:type I restriction enzyme, S subunit